MSNVSTLVVGLVLSLNLQAQIFGVVDTKDKTCKAPTEVFVAKGNELLFQIHVPIGGNFEVKLNKGPHKIIAANRDECVAEAKFDNNGKQQNLVFNLEKVKKDKRNPACGWVADTVPYVFKIQ